MLRPAAAITVLIALTFPAAGQEIIEIDARPITTFEIGSSDNRFGPLEFVGGLELTSPSSDLGGMSAIRLLDDRQRFVGVMDTGMWYGGRIERDDEGRMTGIADFMVAPMRDAEGREEDRKWLVDAEGVAIDGDDILVSFERTHRVDRYSLAGFPTGPAEESLDILVPKQELRGNRGLETVVVAPVESPLEGARLIVSERSLNEAGDVYAAVLEGPRRGIFHVHRDPPFDITDGAFLPDGDLLLLERRFNIAEGVGMRIRRIEADTIRPGETVDGRVLIEADFGYQIDNMEGLDVGVGPDGEVSLILVSDDNHSILQRNLLLEFRFVE